MKIFILLLSSIVLTMMLSSCSKTWSGVKQDSSKAWKESKKVVHNATA
jgi:predicted small secreted protein